MAEIGDHPCPARPERGQLVTVCNRDEDTALSALESFDPIPHPPFSRRLIAVGAIALRNDKVDGSDFSDHRHRLGSCRYHARDENHCQGETSKYP